ncbi:MAG: chemotaxis protein CheW [Bacteroidia bacterium]
MSVTDSEYTPQDVAREAGNEVLKKTEVSERIQLIVFKLGNEDYGLPIDAIREVISTPRIARVPQTPDYVIGVANIRGNIITILDLEHKFGLRQDSDTGSLNHNFTLVVKSDTYKVGILVKEVPTTLTINSSDIDKSASFMQYTVLDSSSITGVVKSGQRMIILIDIISLIETGNIGQISDSIQHS